MEIRTKLLVSAILVVLLPMSVTIVTWFGLLRMDEEIRIVAEEFTEARALQPMDSDLSVAISALSDDSADQEVLALTHLTTARSTLLKYVAEQYASEATHEHQASESEHSRELLTKLDDLIGPEWNTLERPRKVALAQGIRDGIHSLYQDADQGVMSAQAAAGVTERHTLRLVLLVTLASALTCILISAWSTRSVIRRLRELHRNVVTRVDGEAPTARRDLGTAMAEIDELSERMRLRIDEKDRELLRRERMAGIGLLAADVAHEINNPMNAMLGLSELSLRTVQNDPLDDDDREELRESLSVIRREALRCREIVERLMAMVRRRSEPTRFNVGRLLLETVDVARASRPDKARCFEVVGLEPPMEVVAQSQEIRQILLTLLVNAADAVGDDGRIEIDATRSDGEVWLRVRDNGRGFTPEMAQDFPLALRTNRAKEGGVGLGLSIACSLAEDIGAELRPFSDGPGMGSLFVLAIPAKEEST